MYAPFECGMKSGTARVYDHEIPGGQYSNLMVQCQAMGIWDKWEDVLNAYRDVNALLGDVVKVTPSSKCVGDLAIYLVTRGLSVADVLDEGKAAGIDFPASVIELLEGRLGFPHRGFPAQVQKSILKGRPPLSVAPSAALAPADFVAEKLKLDSKWGIDATPEDVISSLLYPKVCAIIFVVLFFRTVQMVPFSLPYHCPPSLPPSLRCSPTTRSFSPPTDPARASSQPRPSTTGWRSGRSLRRHSLCLCL